MTIHHPVFQYGRVRFFFPALFSARPRRSVRTMTILIYVIHQTPFSPVFRSMAISKAEIA